MRKTACAISLLLLASGLMVSCSDDNPFVSGSEGGGKISLTLAADGRVTSGSATRAGGTNDGLSPIVPAAKDFSVSLNKSDGTYSKTWTSTDKFNKENSFPGGDYTLDVHYVKQGAADDEEGFEHPVFHGTQENLHVSPGDVTYASVTATLVNSMVSVRYTDAFKQNFSAYSTSIQTEGHPLVMFARDETRPAFINPSKNIKINVSITNSAGQMVTVQPASFNAEGRHHYIITLDVTGNSTSGNLALNVLFEENVVAETVSVSLGEELWTAAEPEVKATGFEDKKLVEIFEGGSLPAQFDVLAYGGIKSTTLNVITTAYTPSFGSKVELVKADAQTRELLKAEGVEAHGFFTNVDKMGVVKITDFISKLPAGQYTIQVQAVDALTRTSDPVSLNLKVKKVEIGLAYSKMPKFLDEEVEVELFSNTPGVRDKMSFKAPDANGRMSNAKILSVKDGATTALPAGMTNAYTYRLQVSPVSDATLDIEATYGSLSSSVSMDVDIPTFTIEPDAYANIVVLKIHPTDAADLAQIVEQLKIYNNNSALQAKDITRDTAAGTITVASLTPGIGYGNLSGKLGVVATPVPAFTTELATDVTNGAFSTAGQAFKFSNVQVGGEYRVSPVDYVHKSSIDRSSLSGWADLNPLTCWSGTNPKNTWFMVPSTYQENNEAVVRTVGYNHNGTVPAKSGGAFNTKYYCENSPSDKQLVKAAGELFLGSYSYDGSEHRTDGISFSSRPASFTFEYKYAPINGEEGEAYIKLYAADGSAISTHTIALTESASMKRETVDLRGDYTFGVKVARMELGFRSVKSGVTPTINIPTGSALNENQSLGSKTLPANSYHAFAVGSVLTVDNVSLGYEFVEASSVARKRGTATSKKALPRGKR